ncbi:MAG: threonine synthase [Candidatus Schekmanbacteria bacterium]|nr:MAG: threonine synthase [Candidatus Schekmanbacteria bacterium]
MGKVKGLICRECKNEYPAEAIHVCEFCFGPLEVNYDYDFIAGTISKEKIEKGPPSLWRYIDLLPVSGDFIVGENSGFTPLVRAKNLGAELGLNNLYIKNDTVNHPTLSFKDRVVAIALSRAKEFGYDTVACASTGNLANSVAANAAAAGLKCYVFIPGDLEAGKILGSVIYHPTVVAVNGNYDDVNRLCSEVAGEYNWAFVNINIRPYYAEGSKTLAFETAEQLGWKAPDQVVVPVASGSLLTKIGKGFNELSKLGLIGDVKTKINGAQAEGCSPVATAFKNDTEFIKPVKPNTIAKSIAIGNPADGYYSLVTVKNSGGVFETVTDEEIVEGMKLLASKEGIFAETAGGVTIAVLKKLAEKGKIGKDELTVAYVTGNGLKTQEAVVGAVDKPIKINPHLKDFEAILK